MSDIIVTTLLLLLISIAYNLANGWICKKNPFSDRIATLLGDRQRWYHDHTVLNMERSNYGKEELMLNVSAITSRTSPAFQVQLPPNTDLSFSKKEKEVIERKEQMQASNKTDAEILKEEMRKMLERLSNS